MDTLVDDELLIELARPVVAETVPVETELYALLAADYLEKQGTAGRRQPAIGPLAFGLPELYVIMTPIIMAAMNEAVQEVVRDAVARGIVVTKQTLRRLFGLAGKPANEGELVLTDEQWAKVHAIVLRVTVQGGVAEDQARVIADAVVGRGHLRP